MKKVPLLFKSFSLVLFLLFFSAGVFAANTVSDNVPKKINVQGKLTTDSGQPITGSKEVKLTIKVKNGSEVTMSNSNVPVDSDGIYTTDIDVKNVDFSKGIEYFKVTADGVESGQSNFATSPYAFYASSSTYALVLSTSSSIKLEDGNFNQSTKTWTGDNTYNIAVGSATYAKNSSTATYAGSIMNPGNGGQVWGMNDAGTQQGWQDPSSLAISSATLTRLGGIRLGNGTGAYVKTGLVMKDDMSRLGINTGAGLLINNSNQLVLDTSVIPQGTVKSVRVQAGTGLSSSQNTAQTETLNTTISIADNYKLPTITEWNNKQNALPSQDGNNGRFLKTNGSALSWAAVPQGTVKSVRVQTGTGLSSSQNTAQTETLDTTIRIADNYKLPTITEWNNKQNALPSQTGNNGKFLTTNGSALSWAVVNALPSQTGNNGKFLTTNGSTASWADVAAPNIKNLNTNNATAQSTSDSETISGTGTIDLHKVSKTGNYNDLIDKPTIPAAQVNSDWNSTGGLSEILNKPDIPTVKNEYLPTSSDAISGIGVKAALDTIVSGSSFVQLGDSLVNVNDVVNVVGISTDTTIGNLGYNESIQVWAKRTINNREVQGWYTVTKNNNSNRLNGADLAEIYQSTEKLVPGDVVSIDTTKDNAIVKTKVAEDTLVAGVISTEPGLLMNQNEKGYKLALVGKVPTKVCNEGGAIKRGDMLVSASVPGYAKKAGANPKVGTVIGKALESLDSQKGTILVLVNLQ
ncbi:MAG: hypothetical protein IKO48_00420 [Elusimicrobia bacterium]|nr:hypothetical protein [Elusimicrobiota bacterium]